MDRIIIPDGITITLGNSAGVRSYIVNRVIGRGAHCITYEARILDPSGRRVRIKECYPVDSCVHRDGLTLKWADENLKSKAFNGFRDAYSKQVLIQNSEFFGNTFTHVVDEISEGNGTLYTIVDIDNGITFDKDKTDSLEDILRTITALSKVIKTYHEQGYLHLDIKPENFLVISETRDLVKLLDADTIVQKEELRSRNMEVIPYSCGWAAPEQIQGRIKRISEKTDIFSIGAILFDKIMGHCPENDDIGVYAEFMIPKGLVGKYDARLEDILCRILRKTIAASPNRRYESVKELISALEEAIRVCSNKSYIMARESISDVFFVGRENELKDMHRKLQGNVKAIFLHGFGGIGKTELAKKYVQEFKAYYDVSVFQRYYPEEDKGILSYIKNIEIKGIEFSDQEDKEKELEKRINTLGKLCSKKTLFIVDNFDVDNDEYLDQLLSLDAKFIFTTRNDHTYMCSDEVAQIELETMDIEELMQLFVHEYGRLLTEKEINYAHKILNRFDNYTMMVPLIAKQLRASDCSFEEFWNIIEDEGLRHFDDNTENVKHRKDGILTQASLMGHMNYLFKLSKLDDKHKQVLANIKDLESHKGLTKSVYREYTRTENLNALNDLIDRGWIEKQYKIDYFEDKEIMYLQLHPVISELIEEGLHEEKYHRDIITFATEGIKYLDAHPDEEDIRKKIGNIMSVYAEIVDLDPDSGEMYTILYDFYCHEFKKGNLNLNSLLYSAPEFNTTASRDYFRTQIMECHIEKLQEIDHENEIDSLVRRIFDYAMVVGTAFYDTCFYDSTYFVSATMIKLFVLANREIKWCSDLFVDQDGSEAEDESGEKDDYTIENKIIQVMDYILTAYTNYMIISPIEYGKWILSESTVEDEIIFFTNAFAAEFYLAVAELAYRVGKECLNIGRDDAEKYFSIYKGLILVLEYYQGNFFDPELFEPVNIDYYLNMWEEKLSDTIVIDNDELKYKDETGFRLAIARDVVEWRLKLGDSVRNMLIENCYTYSTCIMILDHRFLLDQPASVRKNMLKAGFGNLICNNSNLMFEQKQEILVHKIFEEYKRIMRYGKKYRSRKDFTKKYSVVFKLYISCLESMGQVYEEEIGSELNQMRYEYYYTLIHLYKLKYHKNEKLVDELLEEITPINILWIPQLAELSRAVYCMGLHKKSSEIKKAIAKLWNEKENIIEINKDYGIDVSYTMMDIGKKVKDDKLYEQANQLYQSYDFVDKVNYVISGKSFGTYRIPMIKELYWHVLQFAASILEVGGIEKLRESTEFKFYYSYVSKINSFVEEENLGNIRAKGYLQNLKGAISDNTFVPDEPDGYIVKYYEDTYLKRQRYVIKENKEKFVAWGYILLAKYVLGVKYALLLFAKEIRDFDIKNRDLEACVKAINYFNSEDK